MKVAVIGSTGSVGRQALEVIDKNENLTLCALVANTNAELLSAQAKRFAPVYAELISRDGDCIKKALDLCDIALISTAGITALPYVIYAVENGKKVALANKESLVTGGRLINKALEKYGAFIRPVDSEHSAVFQCIKGEEKFVRSVILTASGGAFRDYTKEEIRLKRAEDALMHPTWSMGRKITVDSATLMNKTFEVIEAYYLFGKKPSVTLHRQSIVHSMVEFTDGSVKAQLAFPDMALPISYALTYPERKENVVKPLDFSEAIGLTFERVDKERFPCITLADRALENQSLSAVMNGADDVCVEAYLQGKIGFYDIFDVISQTLDIAELKRDEAHLEEESVEGVFARDLFGRKTAYGIIKKLN